MVSYVLHKPTNITIWLQTHHVVGRFLAVNYHFEYKGFEVILTKNKFGKYDAMVELQFVPGATMTVHELRDCAAVIDSVSGYLCSMLNNHSTIEHYLDFQACDIVYK